MISSHRDDADWACRTCSVAGRQVRMHDHCPRRQSGYTSGQFAHRPLYRKAGRDGPRTARRESTICADREHTVRMQLSDVYFIVIESPFRLDIQGDSYSPSPEEEPDDALRALRQLVGHTI